MDFYTKLARRPQLFLSVTGMHLHTFQNLLPQFEQAFLKRKAERKLKTVRTTTL